MRNIERLSRHITKYGSSNILVHTLAGTKNWVIAEKTDINKWFLSMCDPMGNVTFNLGCVNDKQHLELWAEITKMEIEYKTSQILVAKQLKKKIYNFKKKYEANYQKFIKVEKTKKHEKRNLYQNQKTSDRKRNGWFYKFRKYSAPNCRDGRK